MMAPWKQARCCVLPVQRVQHVLQVIPCRDPQEVEGVWGCGQHGGFQFPPSIHSFGNSVFYCGKLYLRGDLLFGTTSSAQSQEWIHVCGRRHHLLHKPRSSVPTGHPPLPSLSPRGLTRRCVMQALPSVSAWLA